MDTDRGLHDGPRSIITERLMASKIKTQGGAERAFQTWGVRKILLLKNFPNSESQIDGRG